ncbi:MAG: hypothetical protein Q4G41_07065 [Coriobacteriales bacterium]|jgi:hypothetical protein|nr:hypothetical protein [Coriobacteriales bacterium]
MAEIPLQRDIETAYNTGLASMTHVGWYWVNGTVRRKAGDA